MAGEVELYKNVLSKLRHISEAWTPKSNLPDKVPPLPDVPEKGSRNDWYNTFKEHRSYLEELLRNYLYVEEDSLNALRKGASCSDLMKKLWTLKKKYKLSAKEDGTNAKKHEYNDYLDIIDEIGKRLSKEQIASEGSSNTEINDPKYKTVSVDDTRSPMVEFENTNKEKTTKPLPDEKRRTSDSQEEVEDLRSELQKVTVLYEDSQKALMQLSEILKPLQENEHEYREATKRYNEVMKVPTNKVKDTIKELKADLARKDSDFKQQQKAFEQVKKELEKKEKECEKHTKELTKRPETAPPGRYMRAIKNRIEGLEREKTMYCEQNLILKNEKDSLMQRLSKIAGTKMKDNNPAIADLSDPNHPERLAEQYREIYDNAWTDVLDKMEEVTRDESNNVKTIMGVLEAIYIACKDEIDSRKRTLLESVGYDENVLQKETCPDGNEVYDSNIKICKDLIKSSAVRMKVPFLEIIKTKTEIDNVINLCGESATKFVTNCTNLCIHMGVQDPPVVLDFSFQSGDNFDKDCLQAFTKGGNVIDYMVWPPMYLHNDGPLLSKGIAQGKSARKDRVIESKMSDQQPDQKTQGEPKEATAVRKATSSTKMKDNDPSIADLGDPNRPHRLAETFKEIFENSWTDVLDKLNEVTREDESNNVKTILDVLKEIVNECKYQIDSRRKTLMEVLEYAVNVLQKQTCRDGKNKCDSNISICKDLIRSSAGKMKYPILEVIKRKTEVAKVIDLCGDIAIKFVTNCTDLCIHMSVHDPPVVFDFSFQRGDTFDKDCLYAFNKGGDVIDYMVWPPLYLHTDGPLLSKGIAQGRKRKDAQAAVL